MNITPFIPEMHSRISLFIRTYLSGCSIRILLLALAIIVFSTQKLEAAQKLPADLTELSLEELMDIEVTSVSKKVQKLADAAAAVFVITDEDIRRSGVTSIPEALRMVPGLQVARIDSNKWAITSRGFNGRFATKLLVLIDGRSVYTPFYSGVYWDLQDTLLEDIERIEVIRGPGAALWGANAVNGIINIITKHAKDTQGGLLTAGFGTEERGFGGVRYGGKHGDDLYYRAYAKYFNRDSFVDADGNDQSDDWDELRAGFRTDWETSNHTSFTFQGDIYDGSSNEKLKYADQTLLSTTIEDQEADVAGGNLLTRWNKTFSKSSDMALQAYYDRTERRTTTLEELRDTFDMDFQHRFALGRRQEIVWGLGYRLTTDNNTESEALTLDSEDRSDNLYSIFAQDEIIIIDDLIHLTLGSKLEHNDYTGLEVQPNARLLWTPHRRHSIWASVSRAVRTPNRAEHDVHFNSEFIEVISGAPSFLVSLNGSSDFESEEVLANELGYRVMPTESLSVDIALFYNIYDNLRTIEVEDIDTSSFIITLNGDNKMDGVTYGAELAADWRISNWWLLQTAYTYLLMDLDMDEDSSDTTSESIEGSSPKHQLSIRSSKDLGPNTELDLWIRYVDELPDLDIQSYITLDVRLSHNLLKNLELSIVGQNLLDNQHAEFRQEIIEILPIEVERSVYGKITWRF